MREELIEKKDTKPVGTVCVDICSRIILPRRLLRDPMINAAIFGRLASYFIYW